MEIPEKVICCKKCNCPIAHNNIIEIQESLVLVKISAEIALAKKTGNTNLLRCKLCKENVGYKYEEIIYLFKDKTYRTYTNKI